MPAQSSTLFTAAKDAPFMNTLGMRFVPVAATKVLFSIWETRVQDYAAFAGVNKVGDAWTRQEKDGVPISRDLEYPVCAVNWEDANAFCLWLTKKETEEGKLPKGASYRLPTDEEWSHVVGLPPEQGTTPAERNNRNGVHFPWGFGYPPTKIVGNYADTTFHEKFPNAVETWQEGYTDGFATTAPVGSFPPNEFGIFDIGGNVWEWCADWNDASWQEGVLRGACWGDQVRGAVLSASRYRYGRSSRSAGLGFRCVLDPGTAETTNP